MKHFKINISGPQRVYGGYDLLIQRIKTRIDVLDPEAEINLYNFAGLNKRLEIVGVIVEFKNIDNFVNSLRNYIEKYLNFWVFTVEIVYIESEVGNGE